MHNSSSKSELRKTLRQRRLALTDEQRSRASENIARHSSHLPNWGTAKHIALYLAADGEIEPARLAQSVRKSGAALYLPVVAPGGSMHFALWETTTELIENGYGIPEPGSDQPQRPVQDLDIVFTPLVGWCANGARLGMGGGFYDRALSATSRPLRVGLGFECQKVEAIPLEDWDIPLDFVVTEAALYSCREGDRGKISPVG